MEARLIPKGAAEDRLARMGRIARSPRRRDQGQDRHRRADQRAARLQYRAVPARRRALAPLRAAADPAERGDEGGMRGARRRRAHGAEFRRRSRRARYIISTLLKIGEESWPIELALANRDQMGFPHAARPHGARRPGADRARAAPILLGARPARLRRRRSAASAPGKSLR